MSLISIKLGNLRNQSVEENCIFISGEPGSNRRPSRWQRDVLPTELPPLIFIISNELHPLYDQTINSTACPSYL